MNGELWTCLNVDPSHFGHAIVRTQKATSAWTQLVREKELLPLALSGVPDEELASALAVSIAAVKERCRAVFDKVGATMPSLIHEDAEISHSERHGRQKRHLVIAYVRAHPEELRPFLCCK